MRLEPPASFTEGQRVVWRELAPPLIAARLLDPLSVGMFEALVVSEEEARRYAELAAEAESEAHAEAARTVADDAAASAARLWRSFLPRES